MPTGTAVTRARARPQIMRYRLEAMCGQRTPVVIRVYQVWQTRYGAGNNGLFKAILAACHNGTDEEEGQQEMGYIDGITRFSGHLR